jgi:Protein of unknown function (DUF3631)
MSRPMPDLQQLLEDYVVTTDAQRLVLGLWIVHTHFVHLCEQTPYLTITSPQKQCGKSRLMELLDLLVPRAWSCVLPSEAVVYRYIDATMPTLLLDEVDAIFNPKTAERHEGLRAILNAGHRSTATVPRCVGTSLTPQDFRVYSAKALAGIGTLPDTITDRAIPIRLQRKRRDERLKRFIRREVEAGATPIREAIHHWLFEKPTTDADGNPVPSLATWLATQRPSMPEELSDRMIEGCEPLVAIADRLGCGAEARAALVEILQAERQDSQENAELRLLRDLKGLFDTDPSTNALLTSAICLRLNADGWADWYDGMSDRHLAALLRPYGIRSKSVRQGDATGKGYHRDDFHEAWSRYLPPENGDAATATAD